VNASECNHTHCVVCGECLFGPHSCDDTSVCATELRAYLAAEKAAHEATLAEVEALYADTRSVEFAELLSERDAARAELAALAKSHDAIVLEAERYRDALEMLLGNEVGPGHPCAGHFEGCHVQWGKHCDCHIQEARAALGEVKP
jgi:cell division septum initiation protein DivIVA